MVAGARGEIPKICPKWRRTANRIAAERGTKKPTAKAHGQYQKTTSAGQELRVKIEILTSF